MFSMIIKRQHQTLSDKIPLGDGRTQNVSLCMLSFLQRPTPFSHERWSGHLTILAQ